MKRASFVTYLGAVAITGALLSGCVADSEAASTLASLPPDRISDEVFRAEDVNLIEFAVNKLRAECMAERGYPQLRQAGVERQQKPFSDMDIRLPPFATVTEQEARLMGFGENRPAETPHVVSYDRGFDESYETCSADAAREIGPDLVETKVKVFELYNDIAEDRDAALATPKERQRTSKALDGFLDCVDSKGFRGSGRGKRDLDSYNIGRPVGTFDGTDPPAPKRIPGTVVVIPAIPERRYHPTPEESELAVAAVQCSDETGFGEVIGEQRVRVTREVLLKHEAEITELRPKVAQLGKAAAKVVGQ